MRINSRATLATNFFVTGRRTHRERNRNFPETVKSYSEHPKTCKSNKNRKSKFFRKTILSFIYIEKK